jgi:hypothetical protein
MEKQSKPFTFSIDDGPTFFADEISIMNNEHKFFLDFKNQSPRIDVRANEALPLAIKHSAVILDPGLAKVFSNMLSEHVRKFEEEHGTIPEPKVTTNNPAKQASTRAKDERPEYFG